MFIETERLIIRSINPEDETAYIDMASDGSLGDIFGDCSDCRNWMASWIQEAQALDREDDPTREYLAYAVTEKSQGTLLGSVGCSYYEDLKQVGVTFFIGSAFRGRGYAAEAVTAYVQYFFAHYDIHRLIATVRDANVASWKTMERAGFGPFETRMYRDINDVKDELYRFYEQEDAVHTVLAHWNLQDSRIRRIYNTAWQVGDDYVLKVYQDQKMLERNLKMLQLLAERNIPVAQIVPTCGNALYVTNHNCFYFLSERLEGNSVTQIDSPKALARTMGV
ncbi:MAG: GNAT family N-acetyltransferase, partial [Acetatifactor sp.]|nr:GNAT family N-acetyltransferase [Acetatifactor sp.]